MKRTEIQKAIIPRNWLFGRLSYIRNNLKNILIYNKHNFTGIELKELQEAQDKIHAIITNKKVSSKLLKTFVKIDMKINEESNMES